MTIMNPQIKTEDASKLQELLNTGKLENILLAHQTNKSQQVLKPGEIIAATMCKYKMLAYMAYKGLENLIENVCNSGYYTDAQNSEWGEYEDKLEYFLNTDFSQGVIMLYLKNSPIKSIEYDNGKVNIQCNELNFIASNAMCSVSWNIGILQNDLIRIENIFNTDMEEILELQNQTLPF